MILPGKKDALHKAWLYRLLSEIYDDSFLTSELYFKGGTCAAMLGYLDRFSVDLDFDFIGNKNDIPKIRKKMENIFDKLGLEIKDRSKNIPQYFLKYPAKENERNTLKIDTTFPTPKANKYEFREFADIDRVINCQTVETMFSNKLAAMMDRYEKSRSIAGRDLYDIHHFFILGYTYNTEVIQERRKKPVMDFFQELADFIERNITETIVNQDLNILLTPENFQKTRKILKRETLIFLHDEIKRLKNKAD